VGVGDEVPDVVMPFTARPSHVALEAVLAIGVQGLAADRAVSPPVVAMRAGRTHLKPEAAPCERAEVTIWHWWHVFG